MSNRVSPTPAPRPADEVPDSLRDLVAVGHLCDAALRAEREAGRAPVQIEAPAPDLPRDPALPPR